MVIHDSKFQEDLTKFSDTELQKRRLGLVSGLFNGDKGSRDNVEKEALIQEIDVEREMRFKKAAQTRSHWALLLSAISICISVITILISILF
jgi:hypothetical protein